MPHDPIAGIGIMPVVRIVGEVDRQVGGIADDFLQPRLAALVIRRRCGNGLRHRRHTTAAVRWSISRPACGMRP